MTLNLVLNLNGTLASPAERTRILPADGQDLLHLLSSLGYQIGSYSLLIVNGNLVNAQTVPVDGDIIDVFPPMCGG